MLDWPNQFIWRNGAIFEALGADVKLESSTQTVTADRYTGGGKEIIQAAFAFLGRDDIEVALKNIEE